MIGEIIPVGIHQGRWMYVTDIDESLVYGRVWSVLRGRWSHKPVHYPREAIDKKSPVCPRPAMPTDGL